MATEENIPPDERSLISRAREMAGQAARSYQNVSGTLTGTNIERQIAEYSELYTQVLLGLHEEVEQQNRKFQGYDQQIESLQSQVASIPKFKVITVIALIVALVSLVVAVALGIALWLAL